MQVALCGDLFYGTHSLCDSFNGQITAAICPHCNGEEETAEYLLLSCLKWEAECQHYLRKFMNTMDMFQGLIEFFVFWASASPYRHCKTGL